MSATESPSRDWGHRFSAWVLRRPGRSVAVGLLLLALALPGLAQLTYAYGSRSNYYEDNPLLQELDAFGRRFSSSEALVLAVHTPKGVFEPESVQLLRKLTDGMWLLPDVFRVDSIVNVPWVRAEGDDILTEPFLGEHVSLEPEQLAHRAAVARAHPVWPGHLISADGRTALLFAFPHVGPQGLEGVGLVRETRALIASVGGEGDYAFHLSGDPALNHAFQTATETDSQTLSPLIAIFSVLLLGWFFRRVTGVLLPFMVVGVTVGATLGLLGWLGLELTPVSAAIPQVLIAVCFADAIHLLVSFRLARAAGMSAAESAHAALVKNFVPTLLTSVSTAIGFLSFSTVAHKGLGGFGIGAGLGALVAWPATYLLLGPCLLRLRWTGVQPTPTRLVESLTRFAVRRRRAVTGAAVLMCAVMAAITVQIRIDSNALAYFRAETPLRQAADFIADAVGGAFSIELVLDTGTPEGVKDPDFLRRVDGFQQWLEAQPEVAKALSITTVLKSVNRALHADAPEAYAIADTREEVAAALFLYDLGVPAALGITDRVSLDQSALRMTVLWSVDSAQRAKQLIDQFTTKAASSFDLGPAHGVEVLFTGRYVLFQRQIGMIIEAFVVSVLTAFVLISILLIVYFRSFRLGALALFANVIPICVGGSILVFTGQALDLGTVLLTSVCLGIAVDDTIHVMANFRAALRAGLSPEDALRRVLTHTVPALWVTTAVLVGVFGSFFFASLVPNARFGVMSAVILATALAVDLTVLPALLLGRASLGEEEVGAAGESAPA